MEPGVVRYVAFWRNVNLGQGASPTRAQLESALVAAGATSAQSFLTNGTVVLSVESESAVPRVLAEASRTLEELCGLCEPVYARPLPALAELVAAEPFAGVAGPDVYQFSASFAPVEALARLEAPLWSPRRDLQVVQVTSGVALCVSHQVAGRAGDGTAFLEKVLAVPVTTRNWRTIVRLVTKFA